MTKQMFSNTFILPHKYRRPKIIIYINSIYKLLYEGLNLYVVPVCVQKLITDSEGPEKQNLAVPTQCESDLPDCVPKEIKSK